MPADSPAVLAPLTPGDFTAIRRLAHEIWHGHYDPIVGPAQVDFMLSRRLADDVLAAFIGADDRWFEVLRVGGEPVGYCSCTTMSGGGVLKLEQLYLAAAHRGRGLGCLMLDHVERHARRLGRHTILLQVNRRNAPAIAFYRRAGFAIRESVVFDIGGGFVMDDHVMTKPVPA